MREAPEAAHVLPLAQKCPALLGSGTGSELPGAACPLSLCWVLQDSGGELCASGLSATWVGPGPTYPGAAS